LSLNDLRHPDCRTCEERERLTLGLMAENRALRSKLAKRVKAELHSEVPRAADGSGDASLSGTLGEAIAGAAGSYSLEFITPEQLAEGIAAWLVGE
jgi:hypothetical protein